MRTALIYCTPDLLAQLRAIAAATESTAEELGNAWLNEILATRYPEVVKLHLEHSKAIGKQYDDFRQQVAVIVKSKQPVPT